MMRKACLAALLAAALASPAFVAVASAAEQGAASSARTLRLGKTVYKSACSGCHRWHGDGGGGYGGAAMSLRSMYLEPEHIIEVIRCGRPGTGMPSHVRDPYKDGSCYGITQDTPGIDLPMQANSVLRSDEIAAVAEYVQANIQGKGEITFSECADYWGEDSQNCRNLKSSDQSSVKTDNPEKVTK